MSSKLPDRKTIIPVKSVFPRDGRFPTKRNKNDNRALLTTPVGFGELMRRHKFRSDFELSLAYKLSEANLQYEYETEKISYQPKIKNYTPDFWFPDYNFFVEAKGKFDAADRAKHLLIKKQNPDIDIRFVFQRARNKIRKNSKTTYAMWCERHNFLWAESSCPQEWFK